MNLIFLISNTKRNSVRVLRVLRFPFFIFPRFCKNAFFVFAENGENEYRQKYFCLTRRNVFAGTRESPEGGLASPPSAHDLAGKV